MPFYDDWRQELSHTIRTVDALQQRFPELQLSAEMATATERFPMAITPYYASLIERADASDPIFRMAVPAAEELHSPAYLHNDPLGEARDQVVPGLVHRYPDRALLLATSHCAVYCRHCTRKRYAGSGSTALSSRTLEQVVEYLNHHPEIKELLLSGGDPATLSTAALQRILTALRSVPSLMTIRFCTRAPVTLPSRFDPPLLELLRSVQPLWVVTHFNHPRELSPHATAALTRLANAGIPVANQTVLLRGVNDSPEVIEQLMRLLVAHRVRPTYLFQCDLVEGTEHLRTPISRGLEIMEYLRGRLGSLAMPTYAVDTEGHGKIPLLPNYILSQSPTHTVLRSYEGAIVSYPEPLDYRVDREKSAGAPLPSYPTVSELARGAANKIESLRPGRGGRQP